MLFQILKRDMLKRKGINVILFLFITLSTVFLTSSVNNILILNSAVDYYLDYAKVASLQIVTSSNNEKDALNLWLQKIVDQKDIQDFAYDEMQVVSDKAITIEKNGIAFDSQGASMYLGTQGCSYSKVFDQNARPFTLDNGEMAISVSAAKRNHLSINDRIQYTMNSTTKTFTIKEIMKDATFGNDMVGMTRFMISPQDFQEVSSKGFLISLYYIDTKNPSEFIKKMDIQGFKSIMNTVSGDTYRLVYSFDMVMAALLILVGICLILIALLVLRFTLTFTMEEQYQEIGILKAIGLRNSSIKKLYLVKYFAIVSIGSILGLFISIPVSSIMIQSVSENMIMASDKINIAIHVLCALMIIVLVVSFCYLCTRKLNKVSAIQAIHKGEDGERYHKKRGLRFASHLTLRVPLMLGCNDILCHMRRYLVLIITFCISFILTTIPLNTLNTMTSNEMVSKFQLNPDSAVYVRQIETKKEGKYTSVRELEKGMRRIEKELKQHGYDASLVGEPIYFLKMQREDKSYRKLMTLQMINEETPFSTYEEGRAPMHENEIAISSRVLKDEGWQIGDHIQVSINGTLTPMIITASYSDYMQLGESARLNPKLYMDKEIMFDYWTVMVNMKTDKTQKEMAAELETILPAYQWEDAQTLMDQNIGGIQDILRQMVIPMSAMLCLVIMLITLLMGKLFIAREKSEIAMMKSIGFRYRSIASWQLQRMVIVVCSAMFISIPLSLLSNQFVLKPIFAIMGANVTIQVDVIQAYLVYPGFLFAGIVIATLLALRGIKTIDIKEMNNLE